MSEERVSECKESEEMNYLPFSMIVIGLLFVSISWTLSVGCALWTVRYQSSMIEWKQGSILMPRFEGIGIKPW